MQITRDFVRFLFLLLTFSIISMAYAFFSTRPAHQPPRPRVTVSANRISYSDSKTNNQTIDVLPTPDPKKPYLTCQYKETSISPTHKYVYLLRSCYDQETPSIIRTSDNLNITNAYDLIFQKSDLLWSPADDWFALRAISEDPTDKLIASIFVSHPDFPELLSPIFSLTPAEQSQGYIISPAYYTGQDKHNQLSFTVSSCDSQQRSCIKTITTTYNYDVITKKLVKSKSEISR